MLRYVWLNIWRHKQRSLITIFAIFVATFILLVTEALMDGFVARTTDGFTNSFVGKAQAHNLLYLEDHSFYENISNPDKIIKIAEENQIYAAPRSYGFGLSAVKEKSSGAMIIGINPEKEKEAFSLFSHMQKGKFISKTSKKEVMLGKKLAKLLKAKIGDEIVLIVQAKDGSIGNNLFSCAGIFKSVGDEFDSSVVMMHQKDFEELFVAENHIHEICFNFKKNKDIKVLFPKEKFDIQIKTWNELYPSIFELQVMMDSFMFLMSIIFALAAGIGILNTMLMSIHERIREYGVLKAIGASPTRIFFEILLEGGFLSILGVILGAVASFFIILYLSQNGIDTSKWMSDLSFMGVAFDPVWHAKFSLKSFILIPFIIIFLSFFISLYPAIISARINILKAIYYE